MFYANSTYNFNIKLNIYYVHVKQEAKLGPGKEWFTIFLELKYNHKNVMYTFVNRNKLDIFQCRNGNWYLIKYRNSSFIIRISLRTPSYSGKIKQSAVCVCKYTCDFVFHSSQDNTRDFYFKLNSDSKYGPLCFQTIKCIVKWFKCEWNETLR